MVRPAEPDRSGARAQHAPLALRLSLELWGVLLLLVVNVLAVLALGANIDRAGDITDRSARIRTAVDSLDRAMVEQEAALRGYVITGTTTFLTPYVANQEVQRAQTATLERLLHDQGVETADLTALGDTMAQWRAQVGDPEIAAVQRRDGTAGERVRTGAGMVLLQDAQGSLDRLRTAVNDSTTSAVLQVERAQDRTKRVMIGTIVLTGLLVALRVALTVLKLTRPLTRLVGDVSAVADGDLDRPVPSGGVPELVRLGEAVESMRLRLLAERQAAARRSLLEGQEQERRRVATGIHDDTVQAAIAASLRLQRLRRRLSEADPTMLTLVDQTEADLGEAIARLRRVVFELHPPTLDDEGLESAMRLYLRETADPAHLEWTVSYQTPPDLDHAARTLAYRLFREAVANVVAHADASRIDVVVSGTDELIRVRIRDDGSGFDTLAATRPVPGHLGLRSSVQLARAAGGDWAVTSEQGRGSEVDYTVPRRFS